MSSIIEFSADSIRPVKSSAGAASPIQLEGKSSATTLICRRSISNLSFCQSAVVRRDSRSTCSISKISPGFEFAEESK